jgi:AcrR family transcriptional regulator
MEADRVDGRRARWDRHKTERRVHILDAAVEVIEENGAAGFQVQQIAERAGLARTVIYRHFADRAELERSIQERIVDRLREQVQPTVSTTGTIGEIIVRIVDSYVRWAADHPALHRMVEQTPAAAQGPTALELAITSIAEQVQGLITLAVDVLGVELGEGEAAALDPLVFGIVGQAFATTRRWAARSTVEPRPDVLARLLARSVWHQIDGHARALGVVLDPDMTLDELARTRTAD